jgi:hypothetical protein
MLLPSSCKYFKNDWVNGDGRKYSGPILKKSKAESFGLKLQLEKKQYYGVPTLRAPGSC